MHFSPATGLPLLCADRQRLTQVFLNLFSNACKYNHDYGDIFVYIHPEADNRVQILVQDTGPGISPKDMPRLFRPFERLSATKLGTEGTGLGLALCKTLVEAMGGEIGVESTPGQGSTFWIQLASVKANPPSGAIMQTGTPATCVEPQYQGTALYIEDNATNLALIERAVARALPAVRLVSTMLGRQGIEMAVAHTPDLILLDLHLPDMHGLEILDRLRSHPRTATIPVIAVSADIALDTRTGVLSAGAQDFISKPVHIASLIHAIGRQLHRRSKANVCEQRASERLADCSC